MILLFSPPALAAQAPYTPRPELDAGHYLAALAEAERRLQQNAGDALAWAVKSQALTSLQRFGEAQAAADRALVLRPGLADALLARGLARAGSAIQARNFSSLRGATGALDDFRAATQADPTLAAAWMSLGLAYQQLPGLLGGSTRKALASADALHRVNPARGDLLRGLVLSLDGRWGEAFPSFQRALAAAPGDPQIVAGYLDALGSRETRKQLGDAAQKARLGAEAWRLLPGVKATAKGVEAVSQALLDAGQAEAAWSVARDGLGHVEAPSLLRLQLGKVAARTGLHREEGLAALDQALREPIEGGSAGPAGAWWRKGQILQALGRKDEARKAAQEALRIDPRHRGARELLNQLEQN